RDCHGDIACGEELIVGAPGTSSTRGSIAWYYTDPSYAQPWRLGLVIPSPSTVSGNAFGYAIAAKHRAYSSLSPWLPGADHPVWIAVGAPGVNTVYIYSVDPTTGILVNSVILMLGTTPVRFGASLAVGDFDGDGNDDLAVGAPD